MIEKIEQKQHLKNGNLNGDSSSLIAGQQHL